MQHSLYFRTVPVIICIVLTLGFFALTEGTAQAQGKRGHTVCSRLPAMVGLAIDTRCNLYTASRHTGYIFCIPPSSKPILLGKVPGTPTALAVDSLRNVFVSTEGGVIYLVSLDGDVVEAHRLTSRPLGLEIDRDGKLLVATEGGDIIRLDRSSLTIAP